MMLDPSSRHGFDMTADERDVGRNLEVLAPQIAEAIYLKYFEGIRMQGMVDPGFLERINGTMIWLTCAMLCHALRALETGIYKKPADFKYDVGGGKGVRLLVRFIKDQDG